VSPASVFITTPTTDGVIYWPKDFSAPVREPILYMLKQGHISPEQLSAALYCLNRVGDRHKLLFYLTLLISSTKQKTVLDTTAMARARRRRVNALWSVSRWSTEHDTLARAATLDSLAARNELFPVPLWLNLPARWPGYRIAGSRRLGMEGLRQKHCVASYALNCSTGRCAIVVVFAAGSRWTVEVVEDRSAEAGCSIAQIKSKHNRLPTAEEEQLICDLLLLTRRRASVSLFDTQNDNQDPAEERLLALIRANRDYLLTFCCSLECQFDGSGDSGVVQEVQLFAHAQDSTDERPFYELVKYPTDVRGQQLVEQINGLLDEVACATGVDWYNDDGGFGQIDIDLEKNLYSISIDTRYTESFNAHADERPIWNEDQTADSNILL
jgi:hypothetical protein